MAPRQQTIIQTQNLDRMRLCFRINVRFSDALLVFNKLIQGMQDTLTYNEYILCCCSSWHAVISRSSSHFCVSSFFHVVANCLPRCSQHWSKFWFTLITFIQSLYSLLAVQFSSVYFLHCSYHMVVTTRRDTFYEKRYRYKKEIKAA